MSNKMNGKQAIAWLRQQARRRNVRLLDAFLLADLHPSNISRWSRDVHHARLSNVGNVEAAIQLLGEEMGRAS